MESSSLSSSIQPPHSKALLTLEKVVFYPLLILTILGIGEVVAVIILFFTFISFLVVALTQLALEAACVIYGFGLVCYAIIIMIGWKKREPLPFKRAKRLLVGVGIILLLNIGLLILLDYVLPGFIQTILLS